MRAELGSPRQLPQATPSRKETGRFLQLGTWAEVPLLSMKGQWAGGPPVARGPGTSRASSTGFLTPSAGRAPATAATSHLTLADARLPPSGEALTHVLVGASSAVVHVIPFRLNSFIWFPVVTRTAFSQMPAGSKASPPS